jgi:hypothetical protein
MKTYKNFYLLLLGLLLLSINVIASRIDYIARYSASDDPAKAPEKVQLESNIPNGQEDNVIKHTSEWSRGKFRAYYSKRSVLTVEAVEVQNSKRRANQLVQEIQRLIDQHTKSGR